MTRLKKELIKRGILFDNTNKNPLYHFDMKEEFFCISNGLIITVWKCYSRYSHYKLRNNFSGLRFEIYDSHYNPIGNQSYSNPRVNKNIELNNFNSIVYLEEEE